MRARLLVFAISPFLLIACGDTPETSQSSSQAPPDSVQQIPTSPGEHSVLVRADSMRGLSQKAFNAMKAEGSVPSDLVRIRSLDRLEQYVEVQYEKSEKPSFDSVFSNRKIFVDPDAEGFFLQVYAGGGVE